MLSDSYINLIQLNGPGIYYEELGGYYIDIYGENLEYFLVLAPSETGECILPWWDDDSPTAPALLNDIHFRESDGIRNCELMPSEHSPLKRWVSTLSINGFSDWYIPAIKELEMSRVCLNSNKTYWSSTNYTLGYSWCYSNIKSIGLISEKYIARAVRRVRLW